jgi:hypothetical protein
MKVLPSVLLAGLLVGCGQSGTSDGAGRNNAPANPGTELPLKRGFYVMDDTACGDASAATLLLVLPGGMNGARDACDFTAIEQTGPTSYRAAVVCNAVQGGAAEQSIYLYDIPDNTRFSYGTEDSNYRSHFRHCEQSRLPDPWRDNDISDLLAE